MTEVYQQTVDQTLDALGVDKTAGLDFAEVLSRQSRYGKNVLPADEGVNWFKLILAQFADIMVVILIVAAAISAILGEATDVIVILAIVALNAMLGIYQEYQAEQALAALSRLQVPRVRVRRAGQVREISAEELVPGDIALIAEGDRIPADGRLIETINLEIEEAALTGESLPVSKDTAPIASDKLALGDRSNMAFMGTAVNFGRGEMVVTTTGLRTELGNIAAMLLQVEEGVTPLQRRLNQLGRVLATGALIVVAIVFAVGFAVQGIPAEQMFLIAISLAVAAVPEGLPALVTIGLSLGANRMVKRNALIRRLPAVETLGSVSVICSDKTGTLTRNEMTATILVLPDYDEINIHGSGYEPQGELTYLGTRDPERRAATVDTEKDEMVLRMLQAMALSTNAYLEAESSGNRAKVVGDNTEAALLVAAQKAGLTRERLEQDLPRVAELPFSSDRKAMTTMHQVSSASAAQLFPGAAYLAITKGAPDNLIEWAKAEQTPDGPKPMDEGRRRQWQERVDRMANDGLRILGVACRSLSEIPEGPIPSIERELTLLGLVGILDPPRPEASEAVRHAKEAGIRTIMITGDHALTAEAIARDLGILRADQKAITGAQLDAMSGHDLAIALEGATCFARVSPAHKLTLVQSLQRTGNIVAMTGDGVNDAPALKQADIGVAMGITGADVSKGAAEMILTDDNFRSIVSAIEEGRAIYDNIKKFIKYLLSSNVGEILVMFVALLINLPIPLLAIQILWINLVTDGLPAIALGFEPAEAGVMQRRPRPINESIFAGGTGRHIIWVGILIAILTLGSYVWGYAIIGLDARSPSLGLEKLDRPDIVALAGEAYVPEQWDAWGDEAQIAFLARRGSAARSQFLEGEGHLNQGDPSRELLNRVERIPRTIAFTVLAFTQMFEVMAIHAGDRSSFFRTGFKGNRLLFWAVLSTFLLQLAVVYAPFVQELFDTSALTLAQITVSFLAASVVLFAVELEKTVIRRELKSEESKILQSMP
ncbi:MAG: cation-translocating P-type ATPase [Chloroflexota bacterium]|nr:cation-translocating P-type ATPase [Chloroflexota bacterium]